MKTIEHTFDFSEESKPTPRTLADVEPYVACVERDGGYVSWRMENEEKVITANIDDGKVFLDVKASPSDIRISRVLGPIRIYFKL